MQWLKDPLASFLLVGGIIFLAARFIADDEISYHIELGPADLTRISEHWAMQMRRPPTEGELQDLVDQFVRDEMYYRESQRLGLDVNDAIVRRRMIQKLTFLTEDIATAAPLAEEALREFFQQNQDDYAVPARYTFNHTYFSPDRRADAKGDAKRALPSAAEGDQFILQKRYKRRTELQIRAQFGPEFATAMAQLEPASTAQGPIQSAYGWHNVTLTDVEPAYVPAFETLAERIATDAKQATRVNANDAYFDDLKTRYTVAHPPLGTVAE
ncbi:MAG: peptidylprolyl isomerase [Pseudomonadota bacterium]